MSLFLQIYLAVSLVAFVTSAFLILKEGFAHHHTLGYVAIQIVLAAVMSMVPLVNVGLALVNIIGTVVSSKIWSWRL